MFTFIATISEFTLITAFAYCYYKRQAVFPFYYFVPPICETAPTVRQSDILYLSGVTSRKMKNDHLPKDKHEQNGIG